ncbi:MAG: hypothetical protein AAGG07_03290 [Planctomycetota bacterium]
MSSQTSPPPPDSRPLCPKVILEGTRLTSKTELAFALQEHPRFTGARKYRYHIPVVSGEWSGFTNSPWGRGLTSFLPHETVHADRTFDAWLTLFECYPYYTWIVDRFHVSAAVAQRRDFGRAYPIQHIEERLAALGFWLVVCTRDEASFPVARERRLEVSGNPSQYDDLSVFVREQQMIMSMARESRLPVIMLDVSENDVVEYADRVVREMDLAGALRSKDPPGTSVVPPPE